MLGSHPASLGLGGREGSGQKVGPPCSHVFGAGLRGALRGSETCSARSETQSRHLPNTHRPCPQINLPFPPRCHPRLGPWTFLSLHLPHLSTPFLINTVYALAHPRFVYAAQTSLLLEVHLPSCFLVLLLVSVLSNLMGIKLNP